MAVGDTSKALLSSLRYRLGDPASLLYSDATLYRALNWGYMEAANSLPDAALYQLFALDAVALVASTSYYALPGDYLRERVLVYKDLPAKRWDISEVGTLGLGTLAEPSEDHPLYYVWAGRLYFPFVVTQAGGETYDLYYVKQPVTISDSADPELGPEFDDIVEQYAASTVLQREPDTQAHSAAVLEQLRILVDTIGQRYFPGGPYEGLARDPRRLIGGTKSKGNR